MPNPASTFGRIIPGMLADKFGRLKIFAVAGMVNGIVLYCMNKAETTAGLVVYSVAFGFTSGMIMSGAAAAFTTRLEDPKNLRTYMGMGMAVSSIAALIGPPINGKFIDVYEGFFEVSILSGVMCLIGGLIALSTKSVAPQGIFGRI